jgi:hypothetical protein
VLKPDVAIDDGQIAARPFGPTAAVEVLDGAGVPGGSDVRVAAAHRNTALPAAVSQRLLLNQAGAAQKRLAAFLGKLGEAVGVVDALKQEINAIAKPSQDGVCVGELIKSVAVPVSQTCPGVGPG